MIVQTTMGDCKSTNLCRRRSARIALAIAAMAGMHQSADAALLYWDGAGTASGTFGTAANWSTSSSAATPNPSAAPGTGDDAIFNISTLTADEVITAAAGPSVLSMQFLNSGTTTVTAASAMGLTTGTGGISVSAGAGAVSFSSNFLMKLGGSQTYYNNSGSVLTIGGAIATSVTGVANTLTIAGSGFTSTGSIGGTGTSATSLVINVSGGGVNFTTSNTFGGGITLTAGTLLMAATNSSFGATSQALTVNGGVIDLNATTASRQFSIGNLTGVGGTIKNNGTTAALVIMGVSDTGGGDFAGSIVDNSNSGTGTINLRKTGTGRITLSGANTYSGGTLINGGTLILNNAVGTSGTGTGAVNVTPLIGINGTIGGSGTIGGITGASAANLTLTGINSSTLAILTPGALDIGGNSVLGTFTVGSTTVNNNVTFGIFSQLTAQLEVGGSDLLNVYGNLSLSSNSDILSMSSLPAGASGTYTLVNYTGSLTGVFNTVIYGSTSYAFNALPSFMTLSYGTGTNSSITVTVPEPHSMAALLLTGVAVLRRVRRPASCISKVA